MVLISSFLATCIEAAGTGTIHISDHVPILIIINIDIFWQHSFPRAQDFKSGEFICRELKKYRDKNKSPKILPDILRDSLMAYLIERASFIFPHQEPKEQKE